MQIDVYPHIKQKIFSESKLIRMNSLVLNSEIDPKSSKECPNLQINPILTKSKPDYDTIPNFRQLIDTFMYGKYLFKAYSEAVTINFGKKDLFIQVFDWNVEKNQGRLLQGLSLRGQEFVKFYRASTNFYLVITTEYDQQQDISTTYVQIIEINDKITINYLTIPENTKIVSCTIEDKKYSLFLLYCIRE
jgi:hypothetical protein